MAEHKAYWIRNQYWIMNQKGLREGRGKNLQVAEHKDPVRSLGHRRAARGEPASAAPSNLARTAAA